MKSKRNTYILLIVVLFIWGALLFQFFSYSSPDTAEAEMSGEVILKPVPVKKRDTFSIDVRYRDPFLGKMYDPGKKKAPRRIKQKEKPPVLWPSVAYKGIVSDSDTGNKVFMVLINGKTYFMKEKQRDEGLLLKSGDRASVTVEYQKEEKEIFIE